MRWLFAELVTLSLASESAHGDETEDSTSSQETGKLASHGFEGLADWSECGWRTNWESSVDVATRLPVIP
ncbi:hypothetical protein [Rhodopirellula baltica]|uniref:Uncharacterized protein n=1 Tax=Rhodopirellula baltica SWK14 TaxID=993516 RepID=L7C812_RHOBT|nr:hypothetical protein [Rhodopirellula baltica]ELP30168.1 hypothetical protein RBSWK_05926 [Rhodopirellula baltica SWK14]